MIKVISTQVAYDTESGEVWVTMTNHKGQTRTVPYVNDRDAGDMVRVLADVAELVTLPDDRWARYQALWIDSQPYQD